MPRLFTALRLPPSIAMQLSLLKGGLNGARWIDTENYHVTLAFFGDVDRHVANDMALALGGIDRYAFELRIDRLDAFGNGKPRALYARIEPVPALMELQAEIERLARRHGVPPDRRKFLPHVTLARLKGTAPHEVAHFIHSRGGYTSPQFAVDGFELLSSKASIGGGPYITEEHYALSDFGEDEDEALEEGFGTGGHGGPVMSATFSSR